MVQTAASADSYRVDWNRILKTDPTLSEVIISRRLKVCLNVPTVLSN